MFGYIRPRKGELLVREWVRYRAVYCGICCRIKERYGQLPRLAVNYDMVLLGLLLLSLSEEDPGERAGVCVLNPLRKKPIAVPGPALDACADLTVLLAWHNGADDTADGNRLRGAAVRLVMGRAHRKAARGWPEAEQAIREHLEALHALERRPADSVSAADAVVPFGQLTGALYALSADRALPALDAPLRAALERIGDRTGRWIYVLDAIDDVEDDGDNGNWNPYAGAPRADAAREAEPLLRDWEEDLDRTAALLPFRRDAGIVQNVIQAGMPDMRAAVGEGKNPGRM